MSRLTSLDLPLLYRGKVRDIYAVGTDRLLMVASDRVSAFDVVLNQTIPRKGEVLTQITAWWLHRLERTLGLRHHLIAAHPEAILAELPELARSRREWAGRSMLVRRTTPVLVECVVRGYLSGSAWKEYQSSGTLAGEALVSDLRESERLDPSVFSPATKAQEGHDENISFQQMTQIIGPDVAAELRARSFDIYNYGRDVAEERGIILADTKFEFGFDDEGALLLIDEVLTPDSSRFWPKESYEVGRGQPSLDKQPIRDWLDAQPDWDHEPPAPDLTPEVVQAATDRYLLAFERLTGTPLDEWIPPTFTEPERM